MDQFLRRPGQPFCRDHDAAKGPEQDPEQVGDGQGRFRPDRSGDQEAQCSEGCRPQDQQRQRRHPARRRRLPAEHESHRADHQDLEEQNGKDGQDLAGDQSGAAQGSGGEEAQHAVAAVEAGGDALAGESGGHGAQGEDAGHGNVDPAAAEAVQQRRDGQADHGQQGQDDREDQLFAVPEHRQRFVFALQQDAAEQRGGGAAENPAHRISLPEMSRNTSSRLRASRLMEPGIMPCAAHHAVSAARSSGVSAPVTA